MLGSLWSQITGLGLGWKLLIGWPCLSLVVVVLHYRIREAWDLEGGKHGF